MEAETRKFHQDIATSNIKKWETVRKGLERERILPNMGNIDAINVHRTDLEMEELRLDA